MGGDSALLPASFAEDGVGALLASAGAPPRCASSYSLEDCYVLDSLDAFGEEQGEMELLGAEDLAQPGWPAGCEYGSVGSPTASPRQQNMDAVTLCFPKDKKTVKRKRVLSSALSFSEQQYKAASPKGTPKAKKVKAEPREAGSLSFSEQQYKAASPKGTPKAKKVKAEPREAGSAAPEATSSLIERLKQRNNSERQLTSSFRGVCWYKRTQRWVVQIKIRGVRVHIGYYKDEVEAAKTYERVVKKVAANPDIDRAELREQN
jgi:hypothetical protein